MKNKNFRQAGKCLRGLLRPLAPLMRFYAAALTVFLAAKVVFAAWNGWTSRGLDTADALQVWLHGLPLDLSTTGYLAIPLWVALLAGVWLPSAAGGKRRRLQRWLCTAYAGFLGLLLAVVFVSDTLLYTFWDFKLDGTVFNYLDSPRGAAASVSTAFLVASVAAILAVAALLFCLFRAVLPAEKAEAKPSGLLRGARTAVLLLAGGLVFLGIRGGTGRSTANVGMVYFSENQYLNHCAVNPVFSIFYSLQKTAAFGDEFNYLPEARRAAVVQSLAYSTETVAAETWLKTPRPNVLVVIMEGCGANFVGAVGGAETVTPRLNQLAAEGIVFTQCYANSFRTDRGTVAILSGYPAFPDLSVMKIPAKSRTLPSIAASLKRVGYHTEFLYGGDKNFTNMNSYLLSTGYERTWGDTDFPPEVRRTHAWGVTDSIVFDRLFEMVTAYSPTRPWHTTLLTLASHEPWQVPYHRIPGDEVANSMAYLDACIGRFVDRLKSTPLWDNTLLVFVADHGIGWPAGMDASNPRRWHIPMIFAGGVLGRHCSVDLVCNQTDLAATLLGILGLEHGEFRFSRDVLSRTYTLPIAFHTWSEGLGVVDAAGCTVLNLKSGQVVYDTPEASPLRLERGKAYLQTIYDDLESR